MKSLFAIATCAILFSCSGSDSPKESTTTAKTPKIIPGVVAVDIYGNFEKKGFTVDKDFTGDGCSFSCNQIDETHAYTINVRGKKPEAIDKVEATVIYAEPDDVSKQFIGYAASVPYEGGNPAAATGWATDHFENGGDTTIGNVRFVLIAETTNARVLALYPH